MDDGCHILCAVEHSAWHYLNFLAHSSNTLVSSNNFHRTDNLVNNCCILLKKNCKLLLNLFFLNSIAAKTLSTWFPWSARPSALTPRPNLAAVEGKGNLTFTRKLALIKKKKKVNSFTVAFKNSRIRPDELYLIFYTRRNIFFKL